MTINVIIPEPDCQCAEQGHVEGEVFLLKVESVEDVHSILRADGLLEPG